MTEVQFKDIKVGDIFTHGDTEYKRIPDQRVSCCKVFNAENTANPAQKIQIQPLMMVKVND